MENKVQKAKQTQRPGRGRPAGKNRVPLNLEERRARNAQYEKERRDENARALADLAKEIGCDPETVQSDMLAMAISFISNRIPDSCEELRSCNEKLMAQIADCERRLGIVDPSEDFLNADEDTTCPSPKNNKRKRSINDAIEEYDCDTAGTAARTRPVKKYKKSKRSTKEVTAAVLRDQVVPQMEPSAERCSVSTESSSVSIENCSISTENYEYGVSPENYGVSTENYEYGVSPENYGVSTQNYEYGVSPENYGVSTQNYGVSTQNYGVSTENYCVSTQNYGVSTQNYGVSTENYSISTENYSVSTESYGCSTENFNVADPTRLQPLEQVVDFRSNISGTETAHSVQTIFPTLQVEDLLPAAIDLNYVNNLPIDKWIDIYL